eukprot:14823565-Alexandrium_andersonii.AAC.1
MATSAQRTVKTSTPIKARTRGGADWMQHQLNQLSGSECVTSTTSSTNCEGAMSESRQRGEERAQ